MTEETGGHQADWRKMIMAALAQQHNDMDALRDYVRDRFDQLVAQIGEAKSAAAQAKVDASEKAMGTRIWILTAVVSVATSVASAVVIWHLTHPTK